MAHAIGLDVGSTNVKAVLVGDDGIASASATRPLTTRRVDGGAEQDAEGLWHAVVEVVRELTDAQASEATDVVAVGVCSQYSSIVPVDAEGRPTADVVMWSDHRGTDHSLAILERHPEAFTTWIDHHGIPTVGSGLALAHILHVQHDRPELHAATAAYLEPMDYVNARLTGRIAATQHTMFMSQLCDNRALGALSYDPELVAMAGVDATRLPPLVPVDSVIGELLPAVAGSLGLPGHTTVYAGTNDTATDAVATGAFAPGRAGLAIGTTSVLVDTVAAKDVDLEHEILSMPGPFTDAYLVWAENGLGGKVLEHVLEQFVFARDELGDHITGDQFATLDEAIASVPPGSGGVLFLPWLAGSLSPNANPTMRGGFLNLSLETQRTHLVRSVAEGVAHNLAWLLPHIERFTGSHIHDVAFVGGAARSAAWCQILADVLDRPIAPVVGPERAVARAAGLLALCRHGVLDRGDLDSLVRLASHYEPRASVRNLYAHRQQQFEAAYDAVLPIIQSLNTPP